MTVVVRADEPGVDAEPEVKPAYLPDREAWRFRVCSKELNEWVDAHRPPPKSPFVRRFEFVANCTESPDGPGFATLRTPYTVQVKELLYPGRPEDVEDPVGKWVYVFRAGELVAEARCMEGGVWDSWTVSGTKKRPSGMLRGVPLDPGPKGNRFKHSYLLSPVKLPQKVLDGIDTARLTAAAAECACSRYEKTAHVPDPLRWACEVNEKYYLPRLSTLSAWLYDEDLAACDFIARVLKAWIEAGDHAQVAGKLERQPDSWLDARRAGMSGAMEAAEEAAAYLAHCLMSVEYQTVEQACLAQGEDELELAAVCLATATRGVLQTKPGREFARHLLADLVRLPRKVIFHDDRPALPDEAFARHRFGQRALLAIFGELYPAWNELEALEVKAAVLKDKASLDEHQAFTERLRRERADAQAELDAKHSPKLRASLAEKLKVQRYLENIGVKTTRTTRHLTGKQLATLQRRRTILERLESNKPITKGLRPGSAAARRLRKEWEVLTRLAEKEILVEASAVAEAAQSSPNAPPLAPEERIAKSEKRLAELDHLAKRYAPFEAFAQKLKLTAGTAVEIVNVANAIADLSEVMAEGKPAGKKSLSVIGALSDLVEHGTGVTELLFAGSLSEGSLRWLKGVGGVAGVVGGVIDALDYREQTLEAIDEYDYGKALGRGIQTAGAAASATGSAMVVVGAIATWAGFGIRLGPQAAVIAGVGAGLVATGHLVAKWLQLNANQVFAIRSFLGKVHGEIEQDVTWSKGRLPSRNPKTEALVLTDLLAQFRVSAPGLSEFEYPDWEVRLLPGYYEKGSTFEVDVTSNWDNAQALVGAAPTAGEPGCAPMLRLPEPEHYRLVVDLDEGEVRQLDGPPLKPSEVVHDADGDVESVLLCLEECEVEPPAAEEEEAPPSLDDLARALAGPPSSRLLRTRAYRVTTLKVRLVRPVEGDPPFRYVPHEKDRAMQVVLPLVGPETSLSVSTGVPLEVWTHAISPKENK